MKEIVRFCYRSHDEHANAHKGITTDEPHESKYKEYDPSDQHYIHQKIVKESHTSMIHHRG